MQQGTQQRRSCRWNLDIRHDISAEGSERGPPAKVSYKLIAEGRKKTALAEGGRETH
jgi:hypothetical protein